MADVKIKVLHMYMDLLDLYGDSGNMEILKYRCGKRNIKFIADSYSIGYPSVDFSQYDLIYFGGGADFEQQVLADDLAKQADNIKKAYNGGTFMLLICGGYQLMGQYYKDSNGKTIDGLKLFGYHTEASTDKSKRCIGNIVLEAELDGEKTKVIGFENHGGTTQNVKTPFGKVLFGNGNVFGGGYEGYFEERVIATYLHGPLLSKNPVVADYIIKKCLERQGYDGRLERLDDELETQCREVMLGRLL